MTRFFQKALLVGAMLFLSACQTTSQYSSGGEYISRYQADLAAAKTGERIAASDDLQALNNEVMAVAAIDPILRLPARIGVARLRSGYSGGISPIPPEELEGWSMLAERLGPGFGEFVPVSPFTAKMLTGASSRTSSGDRVFESIREARLGAAAQKLDAVLIYQTHAETQQDATAFGLLNWTIVGAAMLPGRENSAKADSVALLVDVRNGYPYGTAHATAKDSQYSTYFGSRNARNNSARAAMSQSFAALLPEVETMARDLAKLAPRR